MNTMRDVQQFVIAQSEPQDRQLNLAGLFSGLNIKGVQNPTVRALSLRLTGNVTVAAAAAQTLAWWNWMHVIQSLTLRLSDGRTGIYEAIDGESLAMLFLHKNRKRLPFILNTANASTDVAARKVIADSGVAVTVDVTIPIYGIAKSAYRETDEGLPVAWFMDQAMIHWRLRNMLNVTLDSGLTVSLIATISGARKPCAGAIPRVRTHVLGSQQPIQIGFDSGYTMLRCMLWNRPQTSGGSHVYPDIAATATDHSRDFRVVAGTLLQEELGWTTLLDAPQKYEEFALEDVLRLDTDNTHVPQFYETGYYGIIYPFYGQASRDVRVHHQLQLRHTGSTLASTDVIVTESWQQKSDALIYSAFGERFGTDEFWRRATIKGSQQPALVEGEWARTLPLQYESEYLYPSDFNVLAAAAEMGATVEA